MKRSSTHRRFLTAAAATCLLPALTTANVYAQGSRDDAFIAPVESDNEEAQAMLTTCVYALRGPLTSSDALFVRSSPEQAAAVSECVEAVGSSTFSPDCEMWNDLADLDFVFIVDATEAGGVWTVTADAISPALERSMWSASEPVASDDVVAACGALADGFLATRNGWLGLAADGAEPELSDCGPCDAGTICADGSCLTSCESGSAQDCVSLGYRYASGNGVEERADEALRLWQIACERGNHWGCLEAGNSYSRGEGTPASADEAARLWQLACDAGNEDACNALAGI